MLIRIKRKIDHLFAIRFIKIRRFLEKRSNALWFDYPFGKHPSASREKYLQLAKQARMKVYPLIDKYEEQTGYSIDKEWLHDLALHTQVVVKESLPCYAHGRVLYSALSNYLKHHPQASPTDTITIWETGTARGFSASALQRH